VSPCLQGDTEGSHQSVLNASHLTKLVEPRLQGVALGYRGIVEGLSSCIAPLWAGAMLNVSIWGLFSANCFMIVMTLCMMAGSWRRLKFI
jgi:hypothetical protein